MIRDVTNGYAALYINGNLEAQEYRAMTNPTWTLDVGIGWQNGSGYNELRVDDITETVSGNPTAAYEDSYVQAAADQIFSVFANTGAYYHLENYMQYDNSYSTYSNILADIQEDDNTYNFPYATFLYMGHGECSSGIDGYNHYAFYAGGDAGQDPGSLTPVYDSEIQGQLSYVDHYFVFLWVCFDGNELGGLCSPPYPFGYTWGMPYSWTNGAIWSGDGFASSDSSGYCLISFQGESPMLCLPIGNDASQQNPNQLYEYWLAMYYWYLTNDYSVHDALNDASYNAGYNNFSNFPSYNNGNGNMIWWTGTPGMAPTGWYSGVMRVYGDSNTRLAPWGPW